MVTDGPLGGAGVAVAAAAGEVRGDAIAVAGLDFLRCVIALLLGLTDAPVNGIDRYLRRNPLNVDSAADETEPWALADLAATAVAEPL